MVKQTAAAPQQVIGIPKGVTANFRPNSARAKYFAVLQAHAGKPVSAFTAAVTANPPSVPGRGKLQGKAEPVQGWLSWFTRNGYLTLTNK